ncbi:DNA cytosine methyltransferase [Desulfovibrio falkowii]|uniref:DNA cytosine methyltransferase n=1 Tax=Desulfovibrio sp. WGS1351 TaxID=3366814 RepID=UPI00372D2CFF
MPSDLAGFTQCHFFAGIGVWSYALRQAGWPDDRSVWTGSCPCQPFSSAGKGKGFADERHLWPDFYRLISQCRPTTCFGEQVASKDGLAWLDLVQTDLESSGYAFGAVDSCCASFGAPHIRQRLYWVADAISGRQPWSRGCSSTQKQRIAKCCVPDRLADAHDQRRECQPYQQPTRIQPAGIITPEQRNELSDSSASVCLRLADADNQLESATRNSQGVANDSRPSLAGGLAHSERQQHQWRVSGCAEKPGENGGWQTGKLAGCCEDMRPGPTNGFWGDADWLLCRDGKWRATQSLVIEMADGLADRLGYSRFGDRWSLNPLIQKAENRVGRLKGYGNAINAEQAKSFIEAFMETTKEHQP